MADAAKQRTDLCPRCGIPLTVPSYYDVTAPGECPICRGERFARERRLCREIETRWPALRDKESGSRAIHALARAYGYGEGGWPALEQATDADLLALRGFGVGMLRKFRQFLPSPNVNGLHAEGRRLSAEYDLALQELKAAKLAWEHASLRVVDLAARLAAVHAHLTEAPAETQGETP